MSIPTEEFRAKEVEMSAHMSSLPLLPTSAKFDRRLSGFGTFVHECWRRMAVMRADFELSESSHGARSSERSAERLHDDQAWALTQ